MANYSLMGNDISNAAGDGPPNFPFGFKTTGNGIKDLANASYVITNSDGVGFVTSFSSLTSNLSVTLPLATNNIGRTIQIKKSDNNGNYAIQVGLSGADTLDNQTAIYPISTPQGSITVFASAAGKWVLKEVARIAPTYTSLKTVTSGTYTPPPYCYFLRLRMVGAGGGGAGGGNSAAGGMSAGGTGGTTTFGTCFCTGGAGGLWNSQPVAGGTATIGSGAYGLAIQGGSSTAGNQISGASNFLNGANGAVSPFGGSGSGSYANQSGNAAIANSGSGGGGGGTGNTGGGNNVSGGGGAAGGYLDIVISPVGGSYSWTIPAGGTAGTAGSIGGFAGGVGGSGFIEIYEHYC